MASDKLIVVAIAIAIAIACPSVRASPGAVVSVLIVLRLETRPNAGGQLEILHYPVPEVRTQGIDCLSVRHRVGRQQTGTEVVARPERLTMRPKTRPVTIEPSAFLATETCRKWRPPTSMVGRTAVPLAALMAALSPCQALARPTSPKLRSATLMVVGEPRLGTSCHSRPLVCATFTGLVIAELAA